MGKMRLGICVIALFLTTGLACAEEMDFKAVLEDCSRVMRNRTMSYVRHIGMGKHEAITRVSQRRNADGTMQALEESMFHGALPPPRELLGPTQTTRKVYYDKNGRTEVQSMREHAWGIRKNSGLLSFKIVEEAEISGKEIEYNGEKCWLIYQKYATRDGRNMTDEFIVQRKNHLLYSDRQFDENGRMLIASRNDHFNLTPSFPADFFTIPTDVDMEFAANVEEEIELLKKISREQTDILVAYSKEAYRRNPRRLTNRVKRWLYRAKAAPLETTAACVKVLGLIVAVGCAGAAVYVKFRRAK